MVGGGVFPLVGGEKKGDPKSSRKFDRYLDVITDGDPVGEGETTELRREKRGLIPMPLRSLLFFLV